MTVRAPLRSPFLPWPDGEVLVLASRSPRRAELLKVAGIPFEIRPADDVEAELAADLTARGVAPARYARDLARAKAENVGEAMPDRIVLGADTVVVLDGDILEKPRDPAEARVLLARLAGRSHHVISAVAVVNGIANPVRVAHERSEVTFLPLDAHAIARYVDTGEPMDKAGAYGIQGLGALMVSGIVGCYFNVMGLPLARLGALLRQVLEDRS